MLQKEKNFNVYFRRDFGKLRALDQITGFLPGAAREQKSWVLLTIVEPSSDFGEGSRKVTDIEGARRNCPNCFLTSELLIQRREKVLNAK